MPLKIYISLLIFIIFSENVLAINSDTNKTINTNQSATFIYVAGLTVSGAGSQSRWVLTGAT